MPLVLRHLDEDKRQELVSLMNNFPALFSDTPSQTHLIENNIDVVDAQPIKEHFYHVSLDKRTKLDKEVQYMLENKLEEPSHSSWASPCLFWKKPALISGKLTVSQNQIHSVCHEWRIALTK